MASLCFLVIYNLVLGVGGWVEFSNKATMKVLIEVLL